MGSTGLRWATEEKKKGLREGQEEGLGRWISEDTYLQVACVDGAEAPAPAVLIPRFRTLEEAEEEKAGQSGLMLSRTEVREAFASAPVRPEPFLTYPSWRTPIPHSVAVAFAPAPATTAKCLGAASPLLQAPPAW